MRPPSKFRVSSKRGKVQSRAEVPIRGARGVPGSAHGSGDVLRLGPASPGPFALEGGKPGYRSGEEVDEIDGVAPAGEVDQPREVHHGTEGTLRDDPPCQLHLVEEPVVEHHRRLAAAGIRLPHEGAGVEEVLLPHRGLPVAGDQRLFEEQPPGPVGEQGGGCLQTVVLLRKHEDRIRLPFNQVPRRGERQPPEVRSELLGLAPSAVVVAELDVLLPGQTGHVVGPGDVAGSRDADLQGHFRFPWVLAGCRERAGGRSRRRRGFPAHDLRPPGT